MSMTYPIIVRNRLAVSATRRAELAPLPDGLRCLIAYTVDFDGIGNEIGKGWAPFGAHSAGRYSARRGVNRHLDMLERLAIPATFFVPGYDAEWAPDTVKRIAAHGHEIGAHGYVHEGTLLEPDEEKRRLRLTHSILSDLLGKAPRGWRSPSGQKTSVTLPVLHEMGYLYDSSDKDADAPYTLNFGNGRTMVEIPNNTFSLDDFPFFHFSMTPVSEIQAQWQAEFDARYAEGGFYVLTVHPRANWGSGTPSRVAAIEQILRHIQKHRDVRFASLSEIQAWVASTAALHDEVRI